MKLVTAIIPPERLELTKEELGKIKVFRLTVVDVQGVSGAEPGSVELGGSAAERYSAGSRRSRAAARSFVKLMIAVNEAFVEPTIAAIVRAAEDGDEGLVDEFGRVMVSPLEDVIRVRTGERGPGAI